MLKLNSAVASLQISSAVRNCVRLERSYSRRSSRTRVITQKLCRSSLSAELCTELIVADATSMTGDDSVQSLSVPARQTIQLSVTGGRGLNQCTKHNVAQWEH